LPPTLPGKKGRVERRISIVKDTLRALILHQGLKEDQDLLAAGLEAAYAYNQRPSASGFSPAQRLFGTRPRAFGELFQSGEHQGWHPDALDAGSDLARRLELRREAQEMVARHDHAQLVARSLAARSRVVQDVTVGQRVYFYRKQTPAQRRSDPGGVAARGEFLGPAIVIGKHGPPRPGCS